MKQLCKRLLCLLLMAALIGGCIPAVSFAAENTTDFLGGNGSEANPYLISNATHLQNVSKYASSHFLLLTDIDLGGAEFTPIKNSKGIFSGTFDGGGHTISNVQLRSSYNYRLGLFIENTGTIKNLRVENVDVYYSPSGLCHLGGIVAENKGTISNCYVSGVVNASSTYYNSTAYTGGITAVNHAKVEYCFSDAKVMGDVSETCYSGGIAGNNVGTIEYCANAGSITGPSPWNAYRGGIVGTNRGTVSNCLNTGYVGFESSLGRTCCFGGIAGYSTVDRYVYGISNCVNSGEVYYDHSQLSLDGYYSASGEIVGRVYGEPSMEGCYYLRDTESSVAVGMGEGTATGCVPEQFTKAATFTALDMENTWGFTGDDYTYPVLKAFADYYRTSIPEDTVHFAGGKGTAWDPYRIETKQQLNAVRDYPDACFLLMNDLTFTAEDFQAGGVLQNEQGCWEAIDEFTGSFNGNGHTLSGLSFSADTELNETSVSTVFHMFNRNEGSIKNLTLSDVRIDISASVLLEQQHDGSIRGSGLVATNTGEIVNCHVSGTVNMKLELVPGTTYTYDYPTADTYAALLCESNSGLIKGCSATGTLTAGICGTVDYNRVWPDIYIAGIAATNSGIIDGCKSNADISVTTDQIVTSHDITNYSIHVYAGGIAGKAGDSVYLSSIRNSTSKGSIAVNATSNMTVTSPGYGATAQGGMHHLTYAGGIVGYVGTDSQVHSSMSSCSVFGSLNYSGSETKYASTTITMEHYLGGVVGYNLGDTSNCYSTSQVTMNVVEGHTFDQRSRMFYAGGVVGYTDTDSSMANCYSAGSVSASGTGCNTYAGGAYGYGSYNLRSKGIYALEGNCSGAVSGTNYTVSLTPEQMTLQESYAEYDFQDIWCFDSSDGYAYPRLQAELGELTKLEILGDPGVVTTVEGVMPDVSHIQVRLTYSNGRVSTVSMDANFLSALDLTQIGTQTVPVSLRGVTAEKELTVQVNAKSLAGIALKEDTNAIMYLPTEENLNLAYTQLKLLYDNGTFEYIPVTEDMLSPLDKTTEGTQLLTVTYEGFTTSLPVNVYVPQSIIVTYPTKTDYVLGQPLDLTGSITQMEFRCEDKTWLTDYKTATADSVEYDTQATGEVTVTVTKCGLSSTFVITVNPKVATNVRMVQPTKLTYVTGEDLDLTGGYLTYIFESSDNYSEDVPLTMDMISGYDSNTPGFQTLTVTAEGYSGTFMIRVIERNVTAITLTALPETLTYAEGTAAPDVTGGVLTVSYDDGTQAEVPLTADMISGFDGSKAGIQTLTVTYKDFTASYDVTVEHVYTAEITAPTCTEAGFTTYTCACGDSYTADEVAALGHDAVVDEGKDASCTEDGLTDGSHCGRCEEVLAEQEVIPAKDHSWDDGVITTAPTEDTTGVRTYTCTVCGEEKTEEIPTLEHTHSYETTVIAPTCTAKGFTNHLCACGHSYTTDYVDALGHGWGQWVETVKPDAKNDGINTRMCKRCGETETEVVDNNIFTDVKKDRFEEAILWAYYEGITTGTGDGTTFSPENSCTRKQIVTFLWRAAGEPEPKSMENPFKDVKADRFEKAILWAYYEGITTGTGDGTTFSPENTCTRKQIVTFLWRYNGEPAPESTENPFTDVKNDRFAAAILWAAEQGITTGTGDGSTFSPENPCTRKQIVTFLYRNLNKEEAE